MTGLPRYVVCLAVLRHHVRRSAAAPSLVNTVFDHMERIAAASVHPVRPLLLTIGLRRDARLMRALTDPAPPTTARFTEWADVSHLTDTAQFAFMLAVYILRHHCLGGPEVLAALQHCVQSVAA